MMNLPTVGWLAVGLVFFAIFVLVQSLYRPRRTNIDRNLEAQLHHQDDLVVHQEIVANASFFDRVVRPTIQRMHQQGATDNRFLKQLRNRGDNSSKIASQLTIADHPWGFSVEEFQLLQMGTAAGFALLGALLAVVEGSPLLFAAAVSLGILGYKYPEAIVQKKVDAKQKKILAQYQSVCDMLALSAESGLGLLESLNRVSTQLPGVLSEEIVRTLLEVHYGASEESAFVEMQSRCGLEEITVFVQNILQSRRLGTPPAKVFRDLAQQSRTATTNRAEAQAQKLTVKLIPVTAIFIFLPMLGIIGGPAMFSMHGSL